MNSSRNSNSENKITPEIRRRKSNDKIKAMGIACLEMLPTRESGTDVRLKDLDAICRRAIACLLTIQLACDIDAGNDYEEYKEVVSTMLKGYGVENDLIKKEQALLNNTYNKQDVIDVAWTYEAYWSLIWALGFVENIEDASEICDCEKAIRTVADCKGFEEFKNKCNLRDVEEILDMLDLYYRYDWACTEKRINPRTPIGTLNPEVVTERRRGLEWLISETEDWNDISLDT